MCLDQQPTQGEFSEEQEQKYIADGGHHCPVCGSGQLEGDSGVEVCGGTAHQEVSCSDCGAQWFDLYTLTGIEPRS